MYIILLAGKKVAVFVLLSEKQFSIHYSLVNGVVSQKEKKRQNDCSSFTEGGKNQRLHVSEND